jgi:hypothetical protein
LLKEHKIYPEDKKQAIEYLEMQLEDATNDADWRAITTAIKVLKSETEQFYEG